MHSSFSYNPKSHQPDRPKSKFKRNMLLLKHGKSHLNSFYNFLRGLPKTLYIYKKSLRGLYAVPYDIPAGFCLSTGNEPEILEKIKPDILELRPDSLLLRIPVWTLDDLGSSLRFAGDMANSGIEIIINIIQGQDSAFNLDKWQADLDKIFFSFSPLCNCFIIGHAFNRIKWGIPSAGHYMKLFDRAVMLKNEKYAHINLVGPSVIDFEYIHTLGMLNQRQKPAFDMVNQLLYVDRRGAPENTQNGFDLAHKCLLFRSIIDATLGAEIPFWITEANYPLLVEEEEYCPTSRKEAVDEEHYASYMVRYYIIAICSGCARRVYWWQAAAHGYGLIDNLGEVWRRRKAYYAFLYMRSVLKDSVFTYKIMNKDYWLFRFRLKDDSVVSVAWSLGNDCGIEIDLPVRHACDIAGNPSCIKDMVLSHSPLYIFH